MHPIFDLSGQVALITGGAGLLGRKHAEVIAAAGGIPVLLDIQQEAAQSAAAEISRSAVGIGLDITKSTDVERTISTLFSRFGRLDILINNAANNPKMESNAAVTWSRLENFPEEQWAADLDVGLKGAFLCSKFAGAIMANAGRGVILNIASDLAVIAPDQRLYEKEGIQPDAQPVKPVTYSVVKSALIGLTKYFASYYGPYGVRVNALSPAGVFTPNTDPVLVERLQKLIPMGRMARDTDYQGAVLYLCSEASSYMTGQNLIVDGGRCCR